MMHLSAYVLVLFFPTATACFTQKAIGSAMGLECSCLLKSTAPGGLFWQSEVPTVERGSKPRVVSAALFLIQSVTERGWISSFL